MAGFPGKCSDIQSASPSANYSSPTRNQNVPIQPLWGYVDYCSL